MGIKVLIAEKNGLVRDGICSLVRKQPDMELVGEAEDGIKALDFSRKYKPDIVIMDVYLPVINAPEVTKQIINEFYDIKVIALSMHSNLACVSDMIKAGATGYILMDCLFNDLSDAIRIVNEGGVYLSPVLIRMVVNNYMNFISHDGGFPLESLSDRERKILQLLGEEKSVNKIAKELEVSTLAIELSRNRIMKKLNSTNLADIAMRSLLGGLTSLEISRMM